MTDKAEKPNTRATRKPNEAPPIYQRKRDKVIIAGTSDSSKGLIPWDNDEFEIWGLAWRRDQKRCDLYFDIHKIDETRKKIPKDYIKIINDRPDPLVHIEKRSDIKNLIVYPLKAICSYLKSFDPYGPDIYFASSISYMFAFAMYLGYKEIALFGIDMIDHDEYIWQKPNLEYLIGLARASKIRVYIPKQSALCHASHVYGYEPQPDFGPINMLELESRINEYTKKREQALAAYHTADGAIQEAKSLLKKLQLLQRGKQDEHKGKTESS